MMNAEDYYREDCGNHILLTNSQEIDLIARAQAGDREATEALVRGNQRLVYKIAIRYQWSAGYQELCDLIQWGNMGMLVAISKFDLARGHRFSTYAFWWIRQSIRRNAAMFGQGLKVSYNSLEVRGKLNRHRAQLMEDLEREPTDAELSASSGVSLRRMDQVETTMHSVISLDQRARSWRKPENPEFDLTIGERLSVEDDTLEADKRCLIEQALSCLDKRQADIVRYRHYDDLSFPQIGKHLGISHERVRQVYNKAMDTMRRHLTEHAQPLSVSQDVY